MVLRKVKEYPPPNICSYYGCSGLYLQYEPLEQVCTDGRIRCHQIDSLVWDYIVELITDSKNFTKKLRQTQEEELTATKPKEDELTHIQALIHQTEKEVDDIANALTRSKGLISQRLEIQAKELEKRYEALVSRQSAIKSEICAFKLTENNMLTCWNSVKR